MTRFVKSVQLQVLQQPPTATTADAASTSTLSHSQDTIEMIDLTNDSGTSPTPVMVPKSKP